MDIALLILSYSMITITRIIIRQGINIIVTYEDKYRKIPVYCKMELGKFNRAVFSMKVKKASEKIQNAVDRFGDLKHGPCAVTYDSKGIRIWCDDFDKVSGYIEL